MAVFEKVQDIIADELGKEKEEVTLETSFEELDADSLDLFQIINDIEDEFDVVFGEVELIGNNAAVATLRQIGQNLTLAISQSLFFGYIAASGFERIVGSLRNRTHQSPTFINRLRRGHKQTRKQNNNRHKCRDLRIKPVEYRTD